MSRFWNFVTMMTAGTLAKAEDVNTNFSGVDTGLDTVQVELDRSIQITNAPGTTVIALNAAARANKLVSFDVNGDLVTSVLIGDNKGNHAAAAGTSYVIRDIVKDSTGSLGQDNIYMCNTTHTSTGTLATDVANWDLVLDVAAAAASAAAAAASETAAALSYDSFDDRYLGQKAAEPTLDNDGAALLTGALFFHAAAINRMKVYNGATWQLTTAAAVDVTISDAGTIFTATDVEAALQEVKLIADAADIIVNYQVTGGLVNAYTAAIGLAAYGAGNVYKVRIHLTNTLSSTINLDAKGIKNIKVRDGSNLFAGEMPLNHIAELYDDGTDLILMNPAEVTGTYLAALTSGVGTITLNTSFDTLAYRISYSLCVMSGTIVVSSVSAPSGALSVNKFINGSALTKLAGYTSSSIAFNTLALPAALGLFIDDIPTFANITEQQASGYNQTPANLIGAGTRLIINHTYRVR